MCLVQKLGFNNRHRWHRPNWAAFKKNKNVISFTQPDWLYGLCSETYTAERWDDVVAHIREGKPFVSTNVLEGHVHEDWTVDGLMEKEKHTIEDAVGELLDPSTKTALFGNWDGKVDAPNTTKPIPVHADAGFKGASSTLNVTEVSSDLTDPKPVAVANA